MEGLQENKKIKIIILSVCAVLSLIAVIIIATSGTDESNNGEKEKNNNTEINNNTSSGDATIVGNKEKEVEEREALKYFNMLPHIYKEEYAPFSDYFMLDAAMDLVLSESNPNYSETHVDEIVERIFGDGVSINKENVKDMDIDKSLYYYSPDTQTYYIIPIGMEFVLKTQLLKMVTRDDNNVYVYVNEINGTWHQEEEIYVAVIGDKEGHDIVKKFDSFDDILDFDVWQKEYKDKLPVVRYTLKEQNNRYIITAVERINY